MKSSKSFNVSEKLNLVKIACTTSQIKAVGSLQFSLVKTLSVLIASDTLCGFLINECDTRRMFIKLLIGYNLA